MLPYAPLGVHPRKRGRGSKGTGKSKRRSKLCFSKLPFGFSPKFANYSPGFAWKSILIFLVLSWQVEKSSPQISPDLSHQRFQNSNQIAQKSTTHFCRHGNPNIEPSYTSRPWTAQPCHIRNPPGAPSFFSVVFSNVRRKTSRISRILRRTLRTVKNLGKYLGRHVCRTKLPPKKIELDTKKGLKNASKRSKKPSETCPKNVKPLSGRLKMFHQHFQKLFAAQN